MTVAVLAAENRLSSMFVFFFVALLIVSPFGYRQMRATLRLRRERLGRADPAAGAPTDPGDAGDRADPTDLAHVIAAIAAAGADLAHERDGARSVAVPPAPTVEGRPADDAVVRVLLDDAIRRGGLVARTEPTADGGHELTLTRRDTATD